MHVEIMRLRHVCALKLIKRVCEVLILPDKQVEYRFKINVDSTVHAE